MPIVAVAWNWQYDAPFISALERACIERGIGFRSVTEENLAECTSRAERGELDWNLLLDRAWESDPRFLRLNRLAEAGGTHLLNPPARSAETGNKAAMHTLLDAAGVPVPKLIEFRPESWDAKRFEACADGWRRPFWLKPACHGGGDGVVPLPCLPDSFPLGPEWRNEPFVLQESAAPLRLRGRPAWFRVFNVFGRIFPLWWEPSTHRFDPVTPAETAELDLDCVSRTASAVGRIAGMSLFSTEISVASPGIAEAIDPVNDPVDLRPLSTAADGIPDAVLAAMVETLADGIREITAATPVLHIRDGRTG